MKIVEKYRYDKLTREDGGPDGRKYVDPLGNKLPSVTTILDRTKPPEAKQALLGWKRRMGDKKAEEITKEAAFRGTIMHSYLERYLKGENPRPGTNFYHQQSFKMAKVLIDSYLDPFLDETWGLETGLYYPNLYAGTTDMVGLYQGEPSIIDFKQSNKIKSDDRVFDYKLQLVAYMMAHNKIHGTNISQGVILMCTKDLEPQRWILKGQELEDFKDSWWSRVAEYYDVQPD